MTSLYDWFMTSQYEFMTSKFTSYYEMSVLSDKLCLVQIILPKIFVKQTMFMVETRRAY